MSKVAIFNLETAQDAIPQEVLENSGDNTKFNISANKISKANGFKPTVLMNGILTGAQIAGNSTNNSVDVTAATANLNGFGNVSVSAATLSVVRAVTDTHIINSIVIDNTGSYAVVQGIEGTSFSEVRGAAGGPAYIDEDAIEVGQIRFATQASGAVTNAQIKQVGNIYRDEVVKYTIDYMKGSVTMQQALIPKHSDGVDDDLCAKIFFEGFKPVFTEQDQVQDITPPYESASGNSVSTFGGSRSTIQRQNNDGSITLFLENPTEDDFNKAKGDYRHCELYWNPDDVKRTEGISFITLERSKNSDGENSGSVTLIPDVAWDDADAY